LVRDHQPAKIFEGGRCHQQGKPDERGKLQVHRHQASPAVKQRRATAWSAVSRLGINTLRRVIITGSDIRSVESALTMVNEDIIAVESVRFGHRDN
jgi:hypothetical protein